MFIFLPNGNRDIDQGIVGLLITSKKNRFELWLGLSGAISSGYVRYLIQLVSSLRINFMRTTLSINNVQWIYEPILSSSSSDLDIKKHAFFQMISINPLSKRILERLNLLVCCICLQRKDYDDVGCIRQVLKPINIPNGVNSTGSIRRFRVKNDVLVQDDFVDGNADVGLDWCCSRRWTTSGQLRSCCS